MPQQSLFEPPDPGTPECLVHGTLDKHIGPDYLDALSFGSSLRWAPRQFVLSTHGTLWCGKAVSAAREAAFHAHTLSEARRSEQ